MDPLSLVPIHFEQLKELRNGTISYIQIIKRDQTRPPVRPVCRKLGVNKLSEIKSEADLYEALVCVAQGQSQKARENQEAAMNSYESSMYESHSSSKGMGYDHISMKSMDSDRHYSIDSHSSKISRLPLHMTYNSPGSGMSLSPRGGGGGVGGSSNINDMNPNNIIESLPEYNNLLDCVLSIRISWDPRDQNQRLDMFAFKYGLDEKYLLTALKRICEILGCVHLSPQIEVDLVINATKIFFRQTYQGSPRTKLGGGGGGGMSQLSVHVPPSGNNNSGGGGGNLYSNMMMRDEYNKLPNEGSNAYNKHTGMSRDSFSNIKPPMSQISSFSPYTTPRISESTASPYSTLSDLDTMISPRSMTSIHGKMSGSNNARDSMYSTGTFSSEGSPRYINDDISRFNNMSNMVKGNTTNMGSNNDRLTDRNSGGSSGNSMYAPSPQYSIHSRGTITSIHEENTGMSSGRDLYERDSGSSNSNNMSGGGNMGPGSTYSRSQQPVPVQNPHILNSTHVMAIYESFWEQSYTLMKNIVDPDISSLEALQLLDRMNQLVSSSVHISPALAIALDLTTTKSISMLYSKVDKLAPMDTTIESTTGLMGSNAGMSTIVGCINTLKAIVNNSQYDHIKEITAFTSEPLLFQLIEYHNYCMSTSTTTTSANATTISSSTVMNMTAGSPSKVSIDNVNDRKSIEDIIYDSMNKNPDHMKSLDILLTTISHSSICTLSDSHLLVVDEIRNMIQSYLDTSSQTNRTTMSNNNSSGDVQQKDPPSVHLYGSSVLKFGQIKQFIADMMIKFSETDLYETDCHGTRKDIMRRIAVLDNTLVTETHIDLAIKQYSQCIKDHKNAIRDMLKSHPSLLNTLSGDNADKIKFITKITTDSDVLCRIGENYLEFITKEIQMRRQQPSVKPLLEQLHFLKTQANEITTNIDTLKTQTLLNVSSIISSIPCIHNIQIIKKQTDPMVQFEVEMSSLINTTTTTTTHSLIQDSTTLTQLCHIVVNRNLYPYSTKLLTTYYNLDMSGKIRCFASMILSYAREHDLIQEMTSYAWNLMIIHFLLRNGYLVNIQTPADTMGTGSTSPIVSPRMKVNDVDVTFQENVTLPSSCSDLIANTSISEILLSFFHYYIYEADITRNVFTLRGKGQIIPKSGWSKFRPKVLWRFCLEDPFETGMVENPNDVCSNVSLNGQVKVFKYLHMGYYAVLSLINPDTSTSNNTTATTEIMIREMLNKDKMISLSFAGGFIPVDSQTIARSKPLLRTSRESNYPTSTTSTTTISMSQASPAPPSSMTSGSLYDTGSYINTTAPSHSLSNSNTTSSDLNAMLSRATAVGKYYEKSPSTTISTSNNASAVSGVQRMSDYTRPPPPSYPPPLPSSSVNPHSTLTAYDYEGPLSISGGYDRYNAYPQPPSTTNNSTSRMNTTSIRVPPLPNTSVLSPSKAMIYQDSPYITSGTTTTTTTRSSMNFSYGNNPTASGSGSSTGMSTNMSNMSNYNFNTYTTQNMTDRDSGSMNRLSNSSSNSDLVTDHKGQRDGSSSSGGGNNNNMSQTSMMPSMYSAYPGLFHDNSWLHTPIDGGSSSTLGNTGVNVKASSGMSGNATDRYTDALIDSTLSSLGKSSTMTNNSNNMTAAATNTEYQDLLTRLSIHDPPYNSVSSTTTTAMASGSLNPTSNSSLFSSTIQKPLSKLSPTSNENTNILTTGATTTTTTTCGAVSTSTTAATSSEYADFLSTIHRPEDNLFSYLSPNAGLMKSSSVINVNSTSSGSPNNPMNTAPNTMNYPLSPWNKPSS